MGEMLHDYGVGGVVSQVQPVFPSSSQLCNLNVVQWFVI